MYSALGEPCAAATLTAFQSLPRCTQQPAAGLSAELTEPQTSIEPSACRAIANRSGEPGGWSGDSCHCCPSGEVQTAGPSTAPFRSAPTATYPSGPNAIFLTSCGPLPSRPVAFTRCHWVPSPEWNSATSPALSVFVSMPAARNPPPLAGTTAVSPVSLSDCRSADSGTAFHDSPLVEVHTAGRWLSPVPEEPTATSRPPETATSSIRPVVPGGAMYRQAAPLRTHPRGCWLPA